MHVVVKFDNNYDVTVMSYTNDVSAKWRHVEEQRWFCS